MTAPQPPGDGFVRRVFNTVSENPGKLLGQAVGLTGAFIIAAKYKRTDVMKAVGGAAISTAGGVVFDAYKKDNPQAATALNFGFNVVGNGLLYGSMPSAYMSPVVATAAKGFRKHVTSGLLGASVNAPLQTTQKVLQNAVDESQFAADNPELAFAANLAIGATTGGLAGGITGAVKADSLVTLAEKVTESAVEGAQKKILQGLGGAGGEAFDRGDITPSDIAAGARTGATTLTDFVNRKLDIDSPSAAGPTQNGPAPDGPALTGPASSVGLSEVGTTVANLPQPNDPQVSAPAPDRPPPSPGLGEMRATVADLSKPDSPQASASSPGLSEMRTTVASLPKPSSPQAPGPPPPGPTPPPPGIGGLGSG